LTSKKPTASGADSSFNGTRKLIRPRLPNFLRSRRADPVHAEDPLTHALNEPHTAVESTHAEAFYFQKQVQQQTELTVLLDDGEELQGIVEWYDKCALKMRLTNRNRVLVYKSGIKYLYKTSEAHLHAGIMK
jgi:sRNA-binding regulator protein Hfq